MDRWLMGCCSLNIRLKSLPQVRRPHLTFIAANHPCDRTCLDSGRTGKPPVEDKWDPALTNHSSFRLDSSSQLTTIIATYICVWWSPYHLRPLGVSLQTLPRSKRNNSCNQCRSSPNFQGRLRLAKSISQADRLQARHRIPSRYWLRQEMSGEQESGLAWRLPVS
jgi:hypothetical protein